MESSSDARSSAGAKAGATARTTRSAWRRRRRELPVGRERALAGGAVPAAVPRRRRPAPPDHRGARPASARAGTRSPPRGRPGLHPRQPVRPRGDAPAAARRRGPGQRPRRPARPLRAARDRRPGRAPSYAFGERWGPETPSKDKVFGFKPGNGVHDIHMNQGNSARFTRRRRRLAGRRAAAALPGRVALGRASSSPSRARPGTPTTAPATRIGGRRPGAADGRRRRPCGSSRRWSTRPAGARARDRAAAQRLAASRWT